MTAVAAVDPRPRIGRPYMIAHTTANIDKVSK